MKSSKLYEIIEKNINKSFKPTPFDPTCFNHPTALKVSWSPKKKAGNSLKTRSLTQVSPSKLMYKGAKRSGMIGGILIIAGLIIGASLFIGFDGVFDHYMIGDLFIPLLSIIIGILVIYYGKRPMIIDKQLGYLYKSYKEPVAGVHIKSNKKWVKIDNVIALQLLPEYINSQKNSFMSYEINLVFEDASRYNIIDHGNLAIIENDSKIISEFLGVPVWNKMTSQTYTFKIEKEALDNAYDSTGRYDEEPFVDLNKDKEVDLDEPYDSLKRRKM